MGEAGSISVEQCDGSTSLYVFFGGIAAGITMPPFEFYNAAQVLSENKIFVRDFRQCWYHAGLPGFSTDIYSTARYLERQIARIAPEEVVFVGNSMGGFAAILFAHLIGTGRAIAFAPQTFISLKLRRYHGDRRWRRKIWKMYFQTIFKAKIFDLKKALLDSARTVPIAIYYSDDHRMDSLHAEHLREVDGVELFCVDGGGHGVVKVLRDNGDLPAILSRRLA